MLLRKFYEDIGLGRRTGRDAYTSDPAKLPEPLPLAEWREDTSFSEADAVQASPGIARVFESARKWGIEITRRAI